MKRALCFLVLGLFVAGCATSTIEKRRKEQSNAYASLSPEFKTAVDRGQIKVGMSEEAVYIAWGKPDQVLTSQSAQGTFVTWLYHGSRLQPYNYWTYHNYMYDGYYWGHPYFGTSYTPVEFVSAEVVFENGVVKEWRTLPAPTS